MVAGEPHCFQEAVLAVALGFVAGLWTTIAGLGGGMMLLFSLAAWWGDPMAALAVTAPALLVGNLHRLVMFRAEVDRDLGLPIVCGALPGSVVGGLLAVSIPPWVLQIAMVSIALVALARVCGVLEWTPGRRTLVPAGAGIGVIGATTGGAGVLVGPLLLSSGLKGVPYVATGALFGATMHAGRLLAYGVGGWVDPGVVGSGLVIAVAIVAGNLAGRRLRRYIRSAWQTRIELGTVLGLVGLAVVGAAA